MPTRLLYIRLTRSSCEFSWLYTNTLGPCHIVSVMWPVAQEKMLISAPGYWVLVPYFLARLSRYFGSTPEG